MKIKTYAVLKDYFPHQADIVSSAKTINELREELIFENPSAKAILNISRFAIDDTFVDLDMAINGTEIISIIPPSSGG
jgi:molybdopterin synthase sulfur carrier subunit